MRSGAGAKSVRPLNTPTPVRLRHGRNTPDASSPPKRAVELLRPLHRANDGGPIPPKRRPPPRRRPHRAPSRHTSPRGLWASWWTGDFGMSFHVPPSDRSSRVRGLARMPSFDLILHLGAARVTPRMRIRGAFTRKAILASLLTWWTYGGTREDPRRKRRRVVAANGGRKEVAMRTICT